MLGYDNNHGTHHRHYMGEVSNFKFVSYEDLLARFIAEVAALRNRSRCLVNTSTMARGFSKVIVISGSIRCLRSILPARRHARFAQPSNPSERIVSFISVSPITHLASALKRDPKSVRRDVGKLERIGVLRTRQQSNPGHGKIKIVDPVAKKYSLTAAF